MENVVTISLAGAYSFTIERAAAQVLERYLTALRGRLGNDEAAQEVLQSIEERIVELFMEWVPDRSPITLVEVERAKATLGTPDEVCNDGGKEETARNRAESRNSATSDSNTPHFYSRLYRDPQRRVLGGVCGGLSARMGIPVWILRTLFIILSLFYGVAILVYIILWLAIPLARTRLQQMEMRGEPITFSTLEEKIQHEYHKMRSNFKAKSGAHNSVENFFSSFAMLLGSIGVSILKYGIYLFGALLIISSLMSMLGVLFVLFASASWSPDIGAWWHETMRQAPFLPLLISTHNVLFPLLMGVILLILPLIGLCFGVFCLVRRSLLLKIALVGFICWLGAILGVVVLSGTTAIRCNEVYSQKSKRPLELTPGDTLVVSSPSLPTLRRARKNSLFGLFLRSENSVQWRQASVHLEIKPLRGHQGRLVVEKESYGVDEEESVQLLQDIDYPLEIVGKQVILPARYTQRRETNADGLVDVTVTLYVPLGVYVRIDEGIAWRHILWDGDYQRTSRLTRQIWLNSGTEFVLTTSEPFDSLIEEMIPESGDEV